MLKLTAILLMLVFLFYCLAPAADETSVETQDTNIFVFNAGILIPDPIAIDVFITMIDITNPGITYSLWVGMNPESSNMKYEVFMESLFLREQLFYFGGGGGAAGLVGKGFSSFKLLGAAELFLGIKLTEAMNADTRYKIYTDANGIYTALFFSLGMSFDEKKPYSQKTYDVGNKTDKNNEKSGSISGVIKKEEIRAKGGEMTARVPDSTPIPAVTSNYTVTFTYTPVNTATFTQTQTFTKTIVITATAVKTPVWEKTPANIRGENLKTGQATSLKKTQSGMYIEADLMSVVRSIMENAIDANLRVGFFNSDNISFETILDFYGIQGRFNDGVSGWLGGLDLAYNYFPFGNSPSGMYVAPVAGLRYNRYDITISGIESGITGDFMTLTAGTQLGYRLMVEKFMFNALIHCYWNMNFYDDRSFDASFDYIFRVGTGYVF